MTRRVVGVFCAFFRAPLQTSFSMLQHRNQLYTEMAVSAAESFQLKFAIIQGAEPGWQQMPF
jgi:hypothetical protein